MVMSAMRASTSTKPNDMNTFFYKYTWTFNAEEENLLSFSSATLSPLFICPVLPLIHWQIILIPHENYIGAYLTINDFKDNPIEGTLEIKFVNEIHDCYYGLGPLDFRAEDIKNGLGYKNFMEKALIEDFLVDHQLTVWCEIKFLKHIGSEFLSTYTGEEKLSYHENMLLNDIKLLYGNFRFADLYLSVGHEKYFVHKLILAARSEVLDVMIQECEQRFSSPHVLVINDVDCSTMKYLLQYIYTGSTSIPSVESSIALFTAAIKFKMLNLQTYCCDFMWRNRSLQSVIDIYLFAKYNNVPSLQAGCEKFISQNSSKIIKLDSWNDLRKNFPNAYYQLSITLKHLSNDCNS